MWERAVTFPQRLATYPLSWVGAGMDRLLLYTETSGLAQRLSYTTSQLPVRYGLSVGPASLGDRTGLGLAFQARSLFLGGPLKNALTVEHSASTLDYHRTRVRASGKPMAFEYEYEWRPQEGFYGLGMNAPKGDASDYAAQFEHARATMQFGWNRLDNTHVPMAQVTFWAGPRAMVTRTGRESGVASFEQRFPELAASLDRQVEHLTYGVRVSTDWRQGQPRWNHGWRVLVESERFDKPIRALALRNPDGDGAQFTRTKVEFETGFSFMREPRTLRFLGRVVDVGITSGADRMEFQDLSTLGGQPGLGGFKPGRFHDLDQLLGRVTYVFPLVQKIEMALSADVGGVYPEVWKSPRFDGLAHSFGVFVRPHGATRLYGALGVEWSTESLMLRWKLGGSE